jgi:hypothetical protein
MPKKTKTDIKRYNADSPILPSISLVTATKLKGKPIPARRSKILLPSALETAKLPIPFLDASTDTKRSGIEVAIAIIIKLKSDCDKPKVSVI